MKFKNKIIIYSLLFFLIFTFLGFYIKGIGPTNLMITLLSVATFLFGIFAAFIMNDRHIRYVDLSRLMRQNDSRYINILKLAKPFDNKTKEKLKELIDNYFVKTIDFNLEDINKTGKEFTKIFDFILNLKPKGQKQNDSYNFFISEISLANEERKLVEFMVKNKLIFFNWIILNFLAIIIVLAVFYINDNSLISIFISIILSSACIIILLFIYGLDSLEWNDDIWIWEPLHQVFLEMELLPYYPDFILKNLKGKKFLEKGTKIRVARYIPKTNYEEKEVEIITL